MEPLDQEIAEALKERRPKQGPARILIVADDRTCTAAMLESLRGTRHRCDCAATLAEARQAVGRRRYELVLLDPALPDGNGYELAELAARHAPASKILVISRNSTVQTAIDAMRCGACDFLTCPVQASELVERVEAALHRSRVDQQREERIVRLKKVCEQLNIARHEISDQLDLLCRDLVCAYRDMSDQITEVAMSSEFRTLLRQELDIENLLRTALEYLLTKTGPTNAAVFLPDGDQQYSLGAYVNYDCPRDTVAQVLDRLGEAVCPQMAEENEIISFDDAREFAEWIGIDAGMLRESQVLAFSCLHESRCLAVIVLFRAASKPFPESLASTIDILRPIFAEQLANVVRVHRRAEPSWPEESIDDDYDFNDDYGFDIGGLAA